MTPPMLARLIFPMLLTVACGGAEPATTAGTVTSPTSVASIAIVWDGNPLAQSSTVQMKAVPRDARGAELLSKPVTWTSSDPALASVSSSGLVTAIGRTGSVRITAESEGKSSSAEVTLWWLYTPQKTYSVDVRPTFTVRDSALRRDISILIRLPAGAVPQLPVVFVASSLTAGWLTQPEWGNVFAAAGYAVVHIGNSGDLSTRVLCAERQIPDSQCNIANLPLGLEAAHDARVLMDNLGSIGRKIGVVLDSARVGVAGASNGGFVVFHLAGATLAAGVARPDNRFAAFLSNAGPSTTNSLGAPSGFTSTSWADITKPMMVQASTGDPTHRREPYDLMSAGDKYLAFFTTTTVDHGTLGLLQGAFSELIATNGVAFFDAYVRGRAEAKEWLMTNQLARATKGVGQMNAK